MTSASESDTNLRKDDWIEIENIDNNKRKYNPLIATPPLKKANWEYTPSGSICAHFRKLHMYDSNQQKFYNAQQKVFTFIDLVNKICFEITIEVHAVSSFYFISENELIIVWANDRGTVNQILYEIDYINQTVELQDTVKHKFTVRYDQADLNFQTQPSKFISNDEIDYILLIGNSDFTRYMRVDGGVIDYDITQCTFPIYMVPRNPLDKNMAIKEFKLVFSEEDIAELEEKVRILLNGNEHNASFRTFKPNPNTCMVRGTKLWFSHVGLWLKDFSSYEVLGNFWEVDLMQLVDISDRKEIDHPRNLQQLRREQDCAMRFVQRGDICLAEDTNELEFYHSQADIGTLYVTRKLNEDNKEPATTLTVYPAEQSYLIGHEELKYKIRNSIENDCCHAPLYSVHPCGALLQLSLNKNGSIYLRVVKCLGMNLKSLALSKALFHQDTPIRNHPAYRLCFIKTKPIDYNKEKKKRRFLLIVSCCQ